MSAGRIASAVAIALGAAAPLCAAVAYAPCADHMLTSVNSSPLVGQLTGWGEVTETWTWGHVSRTRTRYEGFYRFGDRMVVIDCETHAVIA